MRHSTRWGSAIMIPTALPAPPLRSDAGQALQERIEGAGLTPSPACLPAAALGSCAQRSR